MAQQAFDATKYIYEGVWINWSRGPVLGSTLTVSPQNASILSPALAILVSIAGAQLWTLSQYLLHQYRATSDPRNFVYHQSQSILRNSSSDVDALSRLSRLAIAWRHQKHIHIFASVAPLFAWACFHFLLVVLAGIFSSVVLAGNSDVLSRSPWCGSLNNTYVNDVYYPEQSNAAQTINLKNEYNSYVNSRFGFVQQTVDVCGVGFQHCNGPRPKPLPFTTTFVQGACPLSNSSICHPDAGGSVSFDTGFLSSHAHLGYNAPKEDRVSVRLTSQCSPLKPQGYVTPWQNVSVSPDSSPRQLCDALYGNSTASKRNATATLSKKEPTCDESMLEAPYLLIPQEFLPGTDGSAVSATFDPIDELRVPHADLSLVTLASQSVHTSPVNDPWFSAQQVADSSDSPCGPGNGTLYKREYPLTSIACTQQWQICNTDTINVTQSDRCTSPAGFFQTLDQIDWSSEIALTPRQLATAQRFMFSGQTASIYYFVYALSQSSFVPLKARNAPHLDFGPTIQPDQWKTETKYWMELVLATFQQANLDYSTGQFAASTAYINATTPADVSLVDARKGQNHWLCQNQIIHSSDYRNFNFFALLLTVIVCIIIIVLGLSIEDITGYIRMRKLRSPESGLDSGKHSKQDTWIASSDLNMLRQLDELNHGTAWSLHRNGVPVTHVSHEVSVGDLMRSRYHVEKEVGVVVTPIERRGPSSANAKGTAHKPFMMTSTWEVSPSEVSVDSSQHAILGTSDGQDALTFDPRIIR